MRGGWGFEWGLSKVGGTNVQICAVGNTGMKRNV
jgi:hypothetical protein